MNEKEIIVSKSYSKILSESVETGLKEIKRNNVRLFLSSLSAGLELGFSALLMSAFLVFSGSYTSEIVKTLGVNLFYTIGFVLVVVGKSELFTEHTTLSILPVLDKKATITDLLKNWLTILAGNLSGAFVFAYIISIVGPQLGLVNIEIASHVYHNLLDHSNTLMFISAVLAGWLMGLLTWLVTASKETLSDIFIVIIITFSIGFLGLHHSIAGSIEVIMSIFLSDSITFVDLLNFLFWVILGNAFGGVFFVALLKYSHARE